QLSSLQTVIFGKQPALTGAMQGKLKLGLKQLRGLGVQHALLLDASDGSANRLGFTDTVHAGTTGDALRAFETAADRPVAFISRDATEVPLLAAADIGILLPARGQRAVAASADILVMQDDPAKFAEVTALAHHTVRVATQGIAAGTGLSIALMLLFAVTKLPLLAGVGAQFLVDIIVLGNALRAHQSPRRERAVTEAD
ncbi:MAG TPA: hypothetical protein VHC98_00220, partial [Candidatus Saccharimonadales bacterium]|nr:hypothetical protein [Candidatus Saccharimonadales bacterium]